ncbi:MAG: transposase [Thermoproteota archaeon]
MRTRLGRSDAKARIGRSGKGYGLGYNLHLSVDADSELPIAFAVTPANVRDIAEDPDLLRATRRKLPRGVEHIMADRGYSSDQFRKEVRRRGMEPIIPYHSKEHKGERGFLRIDRRFKTHGLTRLKRLYRKRDAVEGLQPPEGAVELDGPQGQRNYQDHAARTAVHHRHVD